MSNPKPAGDAGSFLPVLSISTLNNAERLVEQLEASNTSLVASSREVTTKALAISKRCEDLERALRSIVGKASACSDLVAGDHGLAAANVLRSIDREARGVLEGNSDYSPVELDGAVLDEV